MAKIRCAGDKSSHVSPCWQTVLSVATPPLGCSERIFTLQKLLLSRFSSLVSASTWGGTVQKLPNPTRRHGINKSATITGRHSVSFRGLHSCKGKQIRHRLPFVFLLQKQQASAEDLSPEIKTMVQTAE